MQCRATEQHLLGLCEERGETTQSRAALLEEACPPLAAVRERPLRLNRD